MPVAYERALSRLRAEPKVWLITGVAGFIGSNLLETLLLLGQRVVGLDNFTTGHPYNLEDVRTSVGKAAWARFNFIEGDIIDFEACAEAARMVDYILHQAALGSVPRSISDPIITNAANVDGFLNMLVAAQDAGVRRFVYATSSSIYGDHTALPAVEDRIGQPLSPYAVTKHVNELYAGVFARVYGVEVIGLRYFNVFGRRQDPNGPYAAVVPKWIDNLLRREPCTINGSGEISRDFCYIENVIQANLLAATTRDDAALNQVYNVGFSESTTLNSLYSLTRDSLVRVRPDLSDLAELEPVYGPFRSGDLRHSQADIRRAASLLGYKPTHSVDQGLAEAVAWYVTHSFKRVRSLTFSFLSPPRGRTGGS